MEGKVGGGGEKCVKVRGLGEVREVGEGERSMWRGRGSEEDYEEKGVRGDIGEIYEGERNQKKCMNDQCVGTNFSSLSCF